MDIGTLYISLKIDRIIKRRHVLKIHNQSGSTSCSRRVRSNRVRGGDRRCRRWWFIDQRGWGGDNFGGCGDSGDSWHWDDICACSRQYSKSSFPSVEADRVPPSGVSEAGVLSCALFLSLILSNSEPISRICKNIRSAFFYSPLTRLQALNSTASGQADSPQPGSPGIG
jgi:hypothetical protein